MRKRIVVPDGGRTQRIALEIPTGSATLSGSLHVMGRQPIVLWNQDKTVTAFFPTQKDTYVFEGLPPGQYFIGNWKLMDRSPFTTVTLAAGEHKVLDIDTHNWLPDIAYLNLHVAGENGYLLHHADIWLEQGGEPVEHAQPDTKGYSLAVPPGTYLLVVQCPGYEIHTEQVVLKKTSLRDVFRRQIYQTVILKQKTE